MSRFVDILARAAALAGGVVLIALVAMTCISVLGRAGLTMSGMFDLPEFFSRLRPVRGDYEMIELGSAVAIFAFLPWCQLAGAHARVDLLEGRLPRWLDRGLVAFWDWVMLGVVMIIAWRHWVGLQGKIASNETTFLLQVPVWWAYAAAMVFAVIGVIVASWVAISHPRAWINPRVEGSAE
ncbi:TRAP transporter small permease [Paracoccus tegillarcae]|uniref:TRAP transporter small permease protein n=1 Tax=Paracoccus tegillarcae TaxID=1529068 RepID=A0A2K9EVX5_9RHOB|nr:TRAP transporter small permease subunit [Paracoccus tegillarcae]AUH35066.1 hypothetical protein CUV01_18290 [Paracoccus tegillarcae]